MLYTFSFTLRGKGIGGYLINQGISYSLYLVVSFSKLFLDPLFLAAGKIIIDKCTFFYYLVKCIQDHVHIRAL